LAPEPREDPVRTIEVPLLAQRHARGEIDEDWHTRRCSSRGRRTPLVPTCEESSLTSMTRRTFVRGIAGLAGAAALGGLAACTSNGSGQTPVGPRSAAVAEAERARRVAGRSTVTARLTPRPVTLDLGGRTVETWSYGDQVPGPLLRATAGDLLEVTVDNQLPADTSVHWHGLALRNDMDGVPHITQDPIAAGGSFTYEFVAPDPGTYFYHPHTGVQLDRASTACS
jgi:FtsP/CotA-like multicopper oxidase with cupredoxin domain